jgi:hypothetical protein
MTHKIGNTVIIEVEADGICEFCHNLDELRSYGPQGERICFDCAMKDEAAAEAAFFRLLYGPGKKAQ